MFLVAEALFTEPAVSGTESAVMVAASWFSNHTSSCLSNQTLALSLALQEVFDLLRSTNLIKSTQLTLPKLTLFLAQLNSH